jgi:hypothetical protein
MLWPAPTNTVARPQPLRRLSSCAAVVDVLAPEAPMRGPTAITAPGDSRTVDHRRANIADRLEPALHLAIWLSSTK